MIIANILGGLFAIIGYQLLVFVPMVPFMILITLLVGFVFGSKLFSKSKLAPIFGTGFSFISVRFPELEVCGTAIQEERCIQQEEHFHLCFYRFVITHQ